MTSPVVKVLIWRKETWIPIHTQVVISLFKQGHAYRLNFSKGNALTIRQDSHAHVVFLLSIPSFLPFSTLSYLNLHRMVNSNQQEEFRALAANLLNCWLRQSPTSWMSFPTIWLPVKMNGTAVISISNVTYIVQSRCVLRLPSGWGLTGETWRKMVNGWIPPGFKHGTSKNWGMIGNGKNQNSYT